MDELDILDVCKKGWMAHMHSLVNKKQPYANMCSVGLSREVLVQAKLTWSGKMNANSCLLRRCEDGNRLGMGTQELSG